MDGGYPMLPPGLSLQINFYFVYAIYCIRKLDASCIIRVFQIKEQSGWRPKRVSYVLRSADTTPTGRFQLRMAPSEHLVVWTPGMLPVASHNRWRDEEASRAPTRHLCAQEEDSRGGGALPSRYENTIQGLTMAQQYLTDELEIKQLPAYASVAACVRLASSTLDEWYPVCVATCEGPKEMGYTRHDYYCFNYPSICREPGCIMICVSLQDGEMWLPNLAKLPASKRGVISVPCKSNLEVNVRSRTSKWWEDAVRDPKKLGSLVMEKIHKFEVNGKQGVRTLEAWKAPVSSTDIISVETERQVKELMSNCNFITKSRPTAWTRVGTKDSSRGTIGALIKAAGCRRTSGSGGHGHFVNLCKKKNNSQVPLAAEDFDLLIIKSVSESFRGVYLIPSAVLFEKGYLTNATGEKKGRLALLVYPEGTSKTSPGRQPNVWANDWLVRETDLRGCYKCYETVVNGLVEDVDPAAILESLRKIRVIS
ncbi:hypothetical protein CYMTET_26959 [Cymbomonas tetramitiformis]|uniref:Uncharacterized protein n=1 Tax=Cymbomonas tetramitiformis TaxID=36881 RepID=A0AAE0FQP3_9CHLO|nr:hypothetical protein CYMTET_26959 [Cymbomonas tetramitiformis]